MDPIYSCKNRPSNYNILHEGKSYPLPKKDTYYWYISNFTEDMDKFKVILAFEKVMQIWQRALDGIKPVGQYIHIKSTNSLEEADFIFSFGARNHQFSTAKGKVIDCPFSFDGNQGILAHAWSLNSGSPYGGQMHLDESENWSNMHGFVDNKIHTHLLTVILHEMGHIFDLGHSNIVEAVMYPAYTGIKESLHIDDIEGLSKKLSPIKSIVHKKYYEPIEEVLKHIPWWHFWHWM